MRAVETLRTALAEAAERRSAATGIVLMLIAGLCSSCLHIGIRTIGTQLPVIEIVALRSCATMLATLPVFMFISGLTLRTKRLDLQLLRGLIGVSSMWSWYYALARLPLADSGALSFTTGLFVMLGAALFFGEKVGLRRWSAAAIGFAGMLIILRPGAGLISWAAISAVVSSALWAVSLLMAKNLARYDQSLTISFFQPLTIAPIALLLALPGWVWPSKEAWLILLAAGSVTAVGNYCYVHALRIAEASLVMPLDYVRLLWMAGWGFLFFAEIPLLTTWIGAALIMGATFFITVREAQRARERQRTG
jgi:drug/metabolite transporter (DMT)-like permease